MSQFYASHLLLLFPSPFQPSLLSSPQPPPVSAAETTEITETTETAETAETAEIAPAPTPAEPTPTPTTDNKPEHTQPPAEADTTSAPAVPDAAISVDQTTDLLQGGVARSRQAFAASETGPTDEEIAAVQPVLPYPDFDP